MNNIVFDNVCKSYGHVEVIKNLNLEIPDGQRLILLGPPAAASPPYFV